MTLIDGDRIVTAQLYDDEYEKFKEQKMSIIDFVNAYTDEGVTTADDVLDKIRAEIVDELDRLKNYRDKDMAVYCRITACKKHIAIIDKYTKGDSL